MFTIFSPEHTFSACSMGAALVYIYIYIYIYIYMCVCVYMSVYVVIYLQVKSSQFYHNCYFM